jgi:phosphoribosylaminoimidazolecarboxamide formyltransferase/IMP cyclohydrolase
VLVSVFDKTGLDRLAAGLAAAGVRVVSTGGTAAALTSFGLEVVDISAVTGFPEVLDGRVKTLHPAVFAGILARPDRSDDLEVLAAHGIERFDAVVVNLYGFQEVIARPDATPQEAIELIDIGGPSLVRAAAKNHASTAVITDPEQYSTLLEAIARGGTTLRERRQLAARAFRHTARYDAVIADWMASHAAAESPTAIDVPERIALNLERRLPSRYGENPHQPAALYAPAGTACGLTGLEQLSGKELSYNNLLDLDAAVRLADLLAGPAAVVVKHTNPCGAAVHDRVDDALAAAMAADPTSAFGSIVAVNREFDRACAEVLLAPGLFVEVIAAPGFDPAAVELLTTLPTWKASVRLVQVPAGDPWAATAGLEFRSVAGGLLAQRPDDGPDDPSVWRVVTRTPPPPALDSSVTFAFTVVRRLTSNAICVCQGTNLVAAGSGQTSRVDAVRIALEKAGDRARGGVLASDAFFPFADSIDLIAAAGVAVVVQPGGSKRDPEVIAAADSAGLAMVFTGRRHFRH